MRKARVFILLGCWLFADVLILGEESQKPATAIKSVNESQTTKVSVNAKNKEPEIATRRAGLWEISTTMTWQQSPFAPGAASGIAEGGKHTRQVCLTQEMIDNYGALLPQSHGECRIENKVMRLGGITANWVCAGKITGKGDLETNWTDLEHATGKLHFSGIFKGGTDTFPIEWTTESSSVFKSENCGATKPPVIRPPS